MSSFIPLPISVPSRGFRFILHSLSVNIPSNSIYVLQTLFHLLSHLSTQPRDSHCTKTMAQSCTRELKTETSAGLECCLRIIQHRRTIAVTLFSCLFTLEPLFWRSMWTMPTTALSARTVRRQRHCPRLTFVPSVDTFKLPDYIKWTSPFRISILQTRNFVYRNQNVETPTISVKLNGAVHHTGA